MMYITNFSENISCINASYGFFRIVDYHESVGICLTLRLRDKTRPYNHDLVLIQNFKVPIWIGARNWACMHVFI